MTTFQVVAILITLTAFAAFLNQKLFKLNGSLGMAISGASVSLMTYLIGVASPEAEEKARAMFAAIDYSETIFHGMLSFLLFAGAMHVDLRVLARWKMPVGILATIGVLISALIVAGMAHMACLAAGYDIPFAWLLVFGALISPTDPIAVLALLKDLNAPVDLETKIAGESLLNDGTGVVLFSVFLGMSTSGTTSLSAAGYLFLHEAVGGAVLGLMMGWGGHTLLKWTNDAATEVVMTIAYAIGGYALGEALHVSAPLAVATMGLMIGHGKHRSMQQETREKLVPFWAMFDELLNMALFALVGLAMMALPFSVETLAVGTVAILCSLVGRAVSVQVPLWLVGGRDMHTGTGPAMIWGGLRGGLSLAMALSLPEFEHKSLMVSGAWAAVMFSLLVQAPTMKILLRRVGLVSDKAQDQQTHC